MVIEWPPLLNSKDKIRSPLVPECQIFTVLINLSTPVNSKDVNDYSRENLEFDNEPIKSAPDNCSTTVKIKKNKIDEKICEKLEPKCCVPNCINQSGKVFTFPKDER